MAGVRKIPLAVLILAAALLGRPALADGLQVGKTAPEITFKTLDGRTLDTRSMLGNVVIVTFWATWCPPCREELPVLAGYAKKHAAQGLQVIGLSLDGKDSLDEVNKLADTFGFPVGLLPSPWLPGYGRIWHIPVSFVIDRHGRLAYNGWDDSDPELTAAKLNTIVTPLLASHR